MNGLPTQIGRRKSLTSSIKNLTLIYFLFLTGCQVNEIDYVESRDNNLTHSALAKSQLDLFSPIDVVYDDINDTEGVLNYGPDISVKSNYHNIQISQRSEKMNEGPLDVSAQFSRNMGTNELHVTLFSVYEKFNNATVSFSLDGDGNQVETTTYDGSGEPVDWTRGTDVINNDRQAFYDVFLLEGETEEQIVTKRALTDALGKGKIDLWFNGVLVTCAVKYVRSTIGYTLGVHTGGPSISYNVIGEFYRRDVTVKPLYDVGKSTLSPAADMTTFDSYPGYTVKMPLAYNRISIAKEFHQSIASIWRMDLPNWNLKKPKKGSQFIMRCSYYDFPLGASNPDFSKELRTETFVFTIDNTSNGGKVWYVKPPVELSLGSRRHMYVSFGIEKNPSLNSGVQTYDGEEATGNVRSRLGAELREQRLLDELES